MNFRFFKHPQPAVRLLFFLMHLAEFQKLWRSVPVDSIDEEKIDEYLKKQGISSMQETGPKKVVSVTVSPI